MRFLPPLVAAGLLATTGTGVAAARSYSYDVSVIVDGRPSAVSMFGGTVADALGARGVTVGPLDIVSPALTTELTPAATVTVKHIRPVTVTTQESSIVVWTTATTVDEALRVAGIPADATVVPARTERVPSEGLTLSVILPQPEAAAPTPDPAPAPAALVAAPEATATATPTPTPTPTPTRTPSPKASPTATPTAARTTSAPAARKTTAAPAPAATTAAPAQPAPTTAPPAPEPTQPTVQPAPAAPTTTAPPAQGTTCRASHYGVGDGLNGLKTANGETFDAYGFTAAHLTLKIGTRLVVTNVANGKSVTIRINDRGPAAWTGRCLDLAYGAFSAIADPDLGVITVSYTIA